MADLAVQDVMAVHQVRASRRDGRCARALMQMPTHAANARLLPLLSMLLAPTPPPTPPPLPPRLSQDMQAAGAYLAATYAPAFAALLAASLPHGAAAVSPADGSNSSSPDRGGAAEEVQAVCAAAQRALQEQGQEVQAQVRAQRACMCERACACVRLHASACNVRVLMRAHPCAPARVPRTQLPQARARARGPAGRHART